MKGIFLPEKRQRGGVSDLAKAARLAALTKDVDGGQRDQVARSLGYDARVKAAIGAGTTFGSDYSAADGAAAVSSQFYAALQDTSILFALLEGGAMIRMPTRSRLIWQVLEATAAVRGEGHAVRLTNAQLEMLAGLEPTDAAAIIVISDELLKSGGADVETFIDRALRRATAKAADTEFLAQVVDGDTPVIAAESFSDELDVILDLRSLIEAVEPTEDSRLVLAMNPIVLRDAATMMGIAGRTFPDLGLFGGEILDIPVVPSAALAAGEVALFDGSGLAGNAGLAQVRSTQADVQMSDAPTNDGATSTGSTLVSLWQNNLVGIMARVEFAAARLRDTAVAKLTGVAWGGSVNRS